MSREDCTFHGSNTIDELPDLRHGKTHIFVQLLDLASGLALYEMNCGQYIFNLIELEIGLIVDDFISVNPISLGVEDVYKIKHLIEISEDNEALILREGSRDDRGLAVIGWAPRDGSLPYRLHTGRELVLMRAGTKPLSAFTGRIPPDDTFVEIPEHLFDTYVEEGFLRKHEIREMEDRPVRGIQGHRIVLYAKTGEEWRLNAYALVRSVGNKIGWSERLIRLEGTLLGYEEWQNDAYIAQMNRNKPAR